MRRVVAHHFVSEALECDGVRSRRLTVSNASASFAHTTAIDLYNCGDPIHPSFELQMWWRMPLATILLAFRMACNHCTVHAQQRRDSKGVDETSSNDGDSSSIPVVLVTSFADDELLSVCRGNLLASKEEGKRFGPQHFSSFLDRQSRGLIRAPFLKLHAIFVLIFYTAACLSCFSETNDTECCLGDRAYIPFQDEVEPDTFYLILDFCAPTSIF